MLDFLYQVFVPKSSWGLFEYFFMVFFGILALGIALLVFVAMAALCKMVFYKTYYDTMKEYKGEVVDMQYVPRRTHTTYNAATKTTQTHTDPEKNIVIFRTELRTTKVDSDKLYQRVRIGESVLVKSQPTYIKPRYWQGDWEYDGDMLVSVTSEKNQTVNFNNQEPVTYNKRGW